MGAFDLRGTLRCHRRDVGSLVLASLLSALMECVPEESSTTVGRLKNLTQWVSDPTMTNCSLKASCVATDISLSQYHLCYLCPRYAEEGNTLSDDEDYPFSYLLCVIGALVLFILGAIGVLYFVFSR